MGLPYLFFLAFVQIVIAQQTTCVPGEYRFRGECIKCHRNSYSSFANQTRCEPCPKGTASRRGAEAFERCRPCPKGTFYDGIVERAICRRCPLNTYSDKLGSMECIPCPNDSVSPEKAKSIDECIICPVGLVIERKHPRPGVPNCVRCSSGFSTFKPNSNSCEACPIGMYSNPSVIGCKKCRPGTFAERDGTSNCRECPVDMFQNEEGSEFCKTCPEGSSSKGQKGALRCSPDCNPWSPGCNVKSCPPGFELQVDGKCRKCPEMYISGSRSTTLCSRCQSEGEARANDARTRCVCMPGYTKGVNGLCLSCPKLTSNSDGGKCKCLLNMTFEGKCRCPPLTVQARNQCLPCDLRLDPSCDNCRPPNFFNMSAFQCQKCPPGTFRNFGNNFCQPCPGDSSSEEGSFQCVCKAGRGLIKGKCEMCPPGTFNPKDKDFRTIDCQPCSHGRFQDKSGSTTCEKCPRKLAPVRSGATKCLDPCPPSSRRNLPFNDVCRCLARFMNTGTRDKPVCVARM